MFRIFLPLYAILFVFLLWFSPMSEYLLNHFYRQQWEADIASDYRGFFVIFEKLLLTKPIESWPELAAQASENTNIPVKIFSIDELKANESLSEHYLSSILAGKVVVSDPINDMVYKRIANTNQVARTGPMHTQDDLTLGAELINLLTSLILFLLVFIWAYRLHKKMKALELASQTFRAGNFDARAPAAWHQQVGSLNQSFNQMASTIEEQILQQKELSNAVAHELRTPIACLQFELEELKDITQSAEAQQWLADMEDDLVKLESLVDELLSYSRLDQASYKLNLQPINLDLWLREQLEILRFPSTINIHYQAPDQKEPLTISLDSHHMQRVLSNLIGNATHFAKDRIELSWEPNPKQNKIVINIDDDGPGIPIEKRKDLFLPFTRADKSRSRKSGGVGLGLAIVAKIIQLHQGKIQILDSPLGGARLQIVLPIVS